MKAELEKILDVIQDISDQIDEQKVYLINPLTLSKLILQDKISEKLNPITLEKTYILEGKFKLYPSFQIPEDTVGVTTESEYQIIKNKL